MKVKIMDDPDIYIDANSTEIIFKGPIVNYDSINIGDIVCKFNYDERAPFTFLQKNSRYWRE